MSEDLHVEEEEERSEGFPLTENSSTKTSKRYYTCTVPETAPGQKSQPTAGVKVPRALHHLPLRAAMTGRTEEQCCRELYNTGGCVGVLFSWGIKHFISKLFIYYSS